MVKIDNDKSYNTWSRLCLIQINARLHILPPFSKVLLTCPKTKIWDEKRKNVAVEFATFAAKLAIGTLVFEVTFDILRWKGKPMSQLLFVRLLTIFAVAITHKKVAMHQIFYLHEHLYDVAVFTWAIICTFCNETWNTYGKTYICCKCETNGKEFHLFKKRKKK